MDPGSRPTGVSLRMLAARNALKLCRLKLSLICPMLMGVGYCQVEEEHSG